MGIGAVAGWLWISLRTGTSSGTEVPISIISGLTGVLTGKNMIDQNKPYDNLTTAEKKEVDDFISQFLRRRNSIKME